MGLSILQTLVGSGSACAAVGQTCHIGHETSCTVVGSKVLAVQGKQSCSMLLPLHLAMPCPCQIGPSFLLRSVGDFQTRLGPKILCHPAPCAGSELPAAVTRKFPHLRGCTALKVPDGADVRRLLRGQLAVSVASADGATINATGALDITSCLMAQSERLGIQRVNY